MALYGVETKLSPEEVIEKAKALFGEAGLGLEMAEKNPCCVTFTGGGGYVTVTASAKEKKTVVDLETREWDYDVKRFMRALARA
jgi:hypothetical protein